MTSQSASTFADCYRQQHPNANPTEVQNAATAATEQVQQLLVKAIPTDELLNAMIPVYQKYLTHSDIKAINEFCGTPTGQKLVRNTSAMMMDSMQAVQAVAKKHMPEIQAFQAQMEKAATDESRLNAPPAEFISQIPPVYRFTHRWRGKRVSRVLLYERQS